MRTLGMPLIAAIATASALMGVVPRVRAQSCNPLEIAELLASDRQEDDRFGNSVAVSGMTALIGAYGDDDLGDYAGAVYLYRFDGVEWIEQSKLFASDAQAESSFGYSVALDGNTAAIGAENDARGGGGTGAVYVFRYDGNAWVEEAKLRSEAWPYFSDFGAVMALSGDLIIIGDRSDDQKFSNGGAAYIFRYDGAQWIEEKKLFPSDGYEYQRFGGSVAITGDTAVVGASWDDELGPSAGAAYVFRFNGKEWIEETKLLASDGEEGTGLGLSAAIWGDSWQTIVLGSYGGNDRTGAAYVYRGHGSTWVEETKLMASDGAVDDYFGGTVAIWGETVLVGAPRDRDNGENSGAAYIFHYDGSQWFEEAKLLPDDGEEYDAYSHSVALSSTTAFVGSLGGSDGTIQDTGSVYVYDLNCTTCLELTVENLIAGQTARFTITGGTPGALGVTVYGFQTGQTSIDNYAGFCTTFNIDGINQSKVIGGLNRKFDANGEITFSMKFPAFLSGLHILFQAAERGTCPDDCASNLIEAVVK